MDRETIDTSVSLKKLQMSTFRADPRFTLSKVFSLSLWVIRARFFSFFAISLIVFSPALVFPWYSPRSYLGDIRDVETSLLSLIQSVLLVLLTAILAGGTVNQLSGDRHLFAGGEIGRLALAPPVLLTCFLFSLGMMVGFTLLVIPGVVLTMIWWVAIPAAVIERPGVLRSFGRSLELTKGHRWKILAAFLLTVAAGIAGHAIAAEVLAPGGIGTFFGAPLGESAHPEFIPYLIGSWIVIVMVSAFEAVLVGVSYVLLRMEQERADMDQAVAAFD